MANKNLNAAKTEMKDEFYTQMSDIERELQHYWQHFLLAFPDEVQLAVWESKNISIPFAQRNFP